MDTPTNYIDVCEKALEAKEKYDLTDTQTLLYNHICRGDFKLRNEDGQNFYDKNNKGFGYSGSREWVKKNFKSLIKNGLVTFESLHDCRDGKYTSWYFYDPNYHLEELIDASCYVSVNKLFMIKYYLNLPDGFNKRNKTYGDIEFIYNEKAKFQPYTFKYKGEESIYAWDNNGKGEKKDLTWLRGKPTWETGKNYESFSDMIHDVWSFLAHDGHEYLRHIPGTTIKRIFEIKCQDT